MAHLAEMFVGVVKGADPVGQVKDGEILSHRRQNGCLPPDRLAQEVLTDVLWPDRTPDLLLERAMKISHFLEKYSL